MLEHWQIADDSTMLGVSYLVHGADTQFLEHIELVARSGKLHYIPKVAEQNDGLPVDFTAVSVTSEELIFENKAHDFPQRIRYCRAGKDSLIATISGMQKGQERTEAFPMRRVSGGVQR